MTEGRLDYPHLEQGSDEWLELRRQLGVTCSQIGNVVGVGYKSRAKYWREKTKREKPSPTNYRMAFGIDYEDYVCALYQRVMAMAGRRIIMRTHGFRRFAEDPRSGGSPDRVVEDLDTGEKWILEIKTRIDAPLREEVPASHKLQCVGLCEAYGLPFAHYVCWTPDEALQMVEIHYDRELLWEQMVFPLIREFNDLIETDVEPTRMPRGLKAEREAAINEWVDCHPILS